jgi:hypothetical protein
MLNPMFRTAIISAACFTATVGPAFGQTRPQPRLTDQQFIVKFHELTRAKGDYNKRGLKPEFCRRLGVRPIGNCEVFQARFTTEGRPAAAFYSLDDGRNGMVRIFITSVLEPAYIEDFRVDAEGRLERAVRRRGEASSHIAIKEAEPGFRRVMEFLRSRQDELAGWPDATLVEDAACRKGQIKRVPRDPGQAVCVDRARLKAQ